MRRCIAILVLAIPLAARADLRSAMRELPEWYRGSDTRDNDLAHLAMNTAIAETLANHSPDEVMRAVAKAAAIPERAAWPLAEAALIEAKVEDDGGDAAPELPLLQDALRLAPASPAVVAAYGAFVSTHPQLGGDFETAALPAMRVLTADEALSAAQSLQNPDAAALLADALTRAPSHRALLQALTDLYSPVVRAALLDPHWSASAAANRIAADAELGRAAEIVAVADAVPEALDATVDQQSVRVDAALAAVLIGKPERARQLIAAYKHVDGSEETMDAVVNELLAPGGDPFDALELQIARSFGMRTSGIRGAALIELACRGNYDAFAETVRARAAEPLADDVAEAAARHLPKALADRVRALLPPRREAQAAREASGAIARLLREPRIALAIEHPMPDSADARGVDAIDCGQAQQVAEALHLPPGLWPIRLERRGSEVAGIAVSQSLDAIGEVGRGAYWVLYSPDGETWETLYTGLRENLPYVVLPASRLPLFGERGLNVEVQVRELDLSSITFPPVALRTKREQDNLYIELPWDALRRDSDGDGITDLMEERLATDPHDADSDGDGIPDGSDGLPQVALTAAPSAAAEVYAQLLRQIHLGANALIVGLPQNESERQACVVRASRIGAPAMFLIADDRAPLAPIDINRRVVVLTPAEHDLYDAKFGPTFFGRVDWMLISHDGTRAVISLDESWTGNVYELTRQPDGTWSVRVIGGYIT
jgi:hypothetical protein